MSWYSILTVPGDDHHVGDVAWLGEHEGDAAIVRVEVGLESGKIRRQNFISDVGRFRGKFEWT